MTNAPLYVIMKPTSPAGEDFQEDMRMKKWIAMLLAVMMLVLPLAGLAEAPEELMDKALDDGLTLVTTVCFCE